MSLLHAHFTLRNQQAFQRLLDGDRGQPTASVGISSSGGKSSNRTGPLSANIHCDVNARDSFGCTCLHRACAASDGTEYVRLLLRHPAISVNICDLESRWTPLHRALYHGNLPSASVYLLKPITIKSLIFLIASCCYSEPMSIHLYGISKVTRPLTYTIQPWKERALLRVATANFSPGDPIGIAPHTTVLSRSFCFVGMLHLA